MKKEIRPWGFYEVLLDEPKYKVKRITIKPEQALSLQYHKHRDEHWVSVSGIGTAFIGTLHFWFNEGESFDVFANEKHRVTNDSVINDFVFIEVQTGDRLDEDDIVRIEDRYNRVKEDEDGLRQFMHPDVIEKVWNDTEYKHGRVKKDE